MIRQHLTLFMKPHSLTLSSVNGVGSVSMIARELHGSVTDSVSFFSQKLASEEESCAQTDIECRMKYRVIVIQYSVIQY